jgi:hypothetical protein
MSLRSMKSIILIIPSLCFSALLAHLPNPSPVRESGVNVLKLFFFVTGDETKRAREFVPVKSFQAQCYKTFYGLIYELIS